MKKYKLILASLPFFIFAQNYDLETGEIIEESVDLNYQNFSDSHTPARFFTNFWNSSISIKILSI